MFIYKWVLGVANTVTKVLQHFYFRHADEELEHMQKLFKYVSETSGMPLLGKIDAPKNDYKSLKEVFETTLEHEKFITSKINELVEVTFCKQRLFYF